MIVPYGTFALIFYSFILGLLWSPKMPIGIAEYFANIYARSLWLSFIIVIASFVFGFGDLSIFLFFVVALKLALNRKKSIFIKIDYGHIYSSLSFVGALSFLCILYLALQNYDTVFLQWDAVVSWNRWAIELSKNEYHPQNAAYPILFPGLWSLIYKAQNDSHIWFVAKFSLFFLFLLSGFVIAMFLESRQFLIGFLSLIFLYSFFIDIHPHYGLFSGYMDAPVALLVFLSASILLLFIIKMVKNDAQISLNALELGTVLVALATVTKQAGIILLLPLFYIFLETYFHGHLTRGKILYLLLISLLPFSLFMLILYNSNATYMGNIDHLADLNLSVAGTDGVYSNAFEKISSSFSRVGFFVILLFSFMNFIFVKKIQGRFGLVLFFTALIGFVVYANCCAYEVRNGWWLISLLAVSSFAFLHNLVQSFALHSFFSSSFYCTKSFSILMPRFNAFVLLSSVLAPIFAYAVYDDPKSHVMQYENQMFVGDHNVNRSVAQNISLLDQDGIYLFEEAYPLRSWIPVDGFDAKYRDCSSFANNFDRCLEYYKKLDAGLLVHLRPETYDKFSQLFVGFDFIESSASFFVYGRTK